MNYLRQTHTTMNYIEKFEIPGVGIYRVSQNPDRTFQVWSGGCAVGGTLQSVHTARCYIHNNAKEKLGLAILNATRLLTKLNRANTDLKADVFYLGKFLVETP